MLRIQTSAVTLAILTLAGSVSAQTFDINGQQNTQSSKAESKNRQKHPSSETGMGWGSSIEVARQARAAQTALQHGDYKAAVNYAQKAADLAPQNPDLWFTLAYAERLAGEYQRSVDSYRRGLSERPSSIEGMSGLAQTYAKMGESQEAQEILQRVLAANPTSDKDLQLAGELLLGTDPEKAAEFLRRSEAAKASARTELLLARAYQRAGKDDQAKAWLERARQSAPTNPEVLRAVAAFYRDSGDYATALKILQKVPGNDPNTLAELAYSYQLAGQKRNAADTYLKAARAAPNQVEIQLNAAQALVGAGDFDQAGKLLDHAATLNPDHYRLHAIRGQMDALEHADDDAIREYEAALARLPSNVPEGVLYPISLRVDLSQLYRDKGDAADAARVAQAARDEIGAINIEGPTRPEYLRLRAATEVAAGDTQGAEYDLKEAIRIDPKNSILQLNYANLLWKTDRPAQAADIYRKVLASDPNNLAALGSLGFLMRESGDPKASEQLFQHLASLDPKNYTPYLALGDLYSELHEFPKAQASYGKAFAIAPSHPLIVSGAMNAAINEHDLPLAKQWLDRSSNAVRDNPEVMREHERYLTLTGDYAASADLGYRVLQKLPADREGADYLAYDLLFLERYDDARAVVNRYQPLLEKDRDLPLIAGHIHAHDRNNELAIQDFTRALEIDPRMATGYMNRGYVYNDMRLASKAARDFRKALSIEPNYGDAHLGLAYALLQLRRAQAALREAELAAKFLPESESLYLAKAEAYRQRGLWTRAQTEYLAAIKLNPNNAQTYMAIAGAEYRLRRYEESAGTLKRALLISQDPQLYAELSRAYASLRRRDEATHAIANAERTGGGDYRVLLVTADALRIMGERGQAMMRYSRALETADQDRLRVRLALGELFAEEGKQKDAQQQVALGLAEAQVMSADSVTADDYLNAADVLVAIHEFSIAQRFYGRAQALGADEVSVAIGMANASLAFGDTRSAALQLDSVSSSEDAKNNFEYLVALANVNRQRGHNRDSLSLFAQARTIDADDLNLQTAEMELADYEGRQIMPGLGTNTNLHVMPLFEDENIYQMDARLLGVQNNASLLPPPRRSVETFGSERFQINAGSLPPINGFVGERNAQGAISFPSELLIQDRNTFDTIFNGSISPLVSLGDVRFRFTPGLQYTIRRDTLAPVPMNQDLFRQFLYVESSPIGNWLSFSGNVIREAGPFTDQNLHSRQLSGQIDFRVGRPWDKTTLLTGYEGVDLLFGPSVHEYYSTDMYGGVERKFGPKITASVVADYLRSWRIEGSDNAIAQALRPRGNVEAKLSQRWSLSANGAWSSGRSFHAYDCVTSDFEVSYQRSHAMQWKDGRESASVDYPVRLSFGVEQQTFYDFPGNSHTSVIPVVRLTLF